MDMKIILGVVIVCFFMVSCTVPDTVDSSTSSEEQEITDGFNDLNDLDALEKELDDIDFETVENISFE
ncbi:hypothetical protein COV17_01870 [Candidatus Woesearchaeota archaeon CG10_big_fil_rev_8_21_14_0_10_36_11]|nr:MAG: hypothetical protein COV17_01870 [Candidatus Woesearchaeota archaeon CG10_big_fil_rev_8_21_14_0_10_36_11]